MTAKKEKKLIFSWRHAILESDLHATTRHVLLTLSVRMNDAGGSCFPSTKTLAEETALSERTVITHLQIADSKGWIERKVRGINGQGWKLHEYQAAWPATIQAPETKDPEPTEKDSAPNSQGDKPESAPGAAETGAEPEKSTTVEALNLPQQGTEPPSKGTEPDSKNALNEVQPNTSINSSLNTPVNSPAPDGAGFPPADKKEQQEGAQKAPKKDELWEALMAGCGITAKPTRTESGKWNKALKDIRDAGATAEEIMLRCKQWVKVFPGAKLTPNGLANNWSVLVSDNNAAQKTKGLGGKDPW